MNGIQKMLATMSASALVAAFLFAAPTTASADVITLNPGDSINLATLIAGADSVQIGDKQFGNFFFGYTDNNLLNIDMVAGNVNVVAASNIVGFGLSFIQPLSASGADSKDIVFKYTVLVTDPNFKISDIHLSMTGTAFGIGYGDIGEDVYNDGFGLTNVGHLQTLLWGPNSTFNQLTDQANIVPPVTQLWVQKDVHVTGGGGASFGVASITIVDQTFSQIPEPSTALLVGLGLLGMVALRRNRKS